MKIMSASFLGLALMICAAATSGGNESAMGAITLTRETRANFVVVSDVRVAFEGMQPLEFVGAEFHSGPSHRLEDPNFRVVADCFLRDGHKLTVASNEIGSGAEIADALCGVGPFPLSAKVSFLGTIETSFGVASRVEVDEPEYIRTYDILKSGAIVRNVWRSKASDTQIVYQSEAQSYCDVALPASAFTKPSLSQRFPPAACSSGN